MKELTILVLPFLLIEANANPTSGPFDLLLSTIGHCPKGLEGENLLKYDLKLKRISRKKQVLYANASLLIPFSDKLDIQVNMAKQTNQGWKDNFFLLDIQHACSAIGTYIPGVEQDFRRQTNLGKNGDCPIPARNYSLMMSMNVDIQMVPIFVYGKYRARTFLLRNQNRIFCIEVVMEVVPKKNG